MDILCTRCGEPWDVCSVVEDMTPKQARYFKEGRGCPSCGGKELCQRVETCDICHLYQLDDMSYTGRCRANALKPINPEGRYAQAAMQDALGSDVDGLAAMMEDFNLL